MDSDALHHAVELLHAKGHVGRTDRSATFVAHEDDREDALDEETVKRLAARLVRLRELAEALDVRLGVPVERGRGRKMVRLHAR